LRSASLLLALLACAHSPAERRLETVRVGDAEFNLQYRPEDEAAARQVRTALEQAVPAARRWGTLAAPVLLTIHASHGALEEAAQRRGYDWLRAWTRYDRIDLQSPRTWSRGAASDAEMTRLLAHEITHCVMYQASSSALTWAHRDIPLWFREGMASVTAGESRRVGPREIGRFYREAAGDPLTIPGPLYRSHSDLVYGTAHSAFRFLLERYGEDRIRRLLALMASGAEFEPAFQGAMGIPLSDFELEFKHYVLWRGWRG
jgi:hypothetical protein